MLDVALSLAVVVSLILIGYGIVDLRRKKGNRRRAALMIAAGIVTLINVYMLASMPPMP